MGIHLFQENIISRLAESTVHAQIANEQKFFEKNPFWDYDVLLFMGGSANANETRPPYGTKYGGMLPHAALWARIAQERIVDYATKQRIPLEEIKEVFQMPPHYGKNADIGEAYAGAYVIPMIETQYMDKEHPGEIDAFQLEKIRVRVACIKAAIEMWPEVKGVIPHIYLAGGAKIDTDSDIREADNDYTVLLEALGIAHKDDLLGAYFHNEANYGLHTKEILLNFGRNAIQEGDLRRNTHHLLVVAPNAYGSPSWYAGNIDTLIRTKLKQYFRNFKKVTTVGTFLGYNDASLDTLILEKAQEKKDAATIEETEKVVTKAKVRRSVELEKDVLRKVQLDEIARRMQALASSYSRRVAHHRRRQ